MMQLVLVASLAAVARSSNPSDVWRFPYGSNPYVVAKNARDGLPDYAFWDTNMTYTNKTNACPLVLQKPSCPKESKTCCKTHGKSGTAKLAAGGIYCENYRGVVESTLNHTLPTGEISSSDSREAIPRTRRNMLQRAVGWLAMNTPYVGCGTPNLKSDGVETCAEDDDANCPQYGSGRFCDGFVSMAWGVPGRLVHGAKSYQAFVPCAEMLPGDAVHYHSKEGDTPHTFMFREWEREGNTTGAFRYYQMGGGRPSGEPTPQGAAIGGTTNMEMSASNPKFCKYVPGGHGCGAKCKSCLECSKYANIVNETAALVAP